jgi:hypothetical protein
VPDWQELPPRPPCVARFGHIACGVSDEWH